MGIVGEVGSSSS